ncbi:MAG: hypothetical protein Q3984_03680 [Eubacteriales bacterium]|nr:hypothetical protein [Eubacteriales bacterium]
MIPEIPPQLQGSPEQQLIAMRDYLVRLAQSLEQVGGSDVAAAKAATNAAKAAQEQAAQEVRSTANSLKALIIKTADEITEYTDTRVENFESLYVAKSDYGTYYNQIETQVEQTARDTVETYHYTEAIGELNAYLTDLNGQIRRGVIEDPETHEVHLGIAISEQLSFTGQTQTEGGLTYYELAPGQTLGLYTSTGWQFWINGVRRGWFSSEDSMLHVSNIVVENRLQLGSEWEIVSVNGFGLRYIGG